MNIDERLERLATATTRDHNSLIGTKDLARALLRTRQALDSIANGPRTHYTAAEGYAAFKDVSKQALADTELEEAMKS